MTGVELRRARERLRMTGRGLAKALEIPPETVSRWEHGKMKIEHAGILRLALEKLALERLVETWGEK